MSLKINSLLDSVRVNNSDAEIGTSILPLQANKESTETCYI